MLDKRTYGECLSETAERFPDKTALYYDSVSYTWGEVDAIVSALAYRMMRQGVERGAHVGIWSVNSANWVFTFLACSRLGALPIPINSCYKAEELYQILRYAEVSYLHYGKSYKDYRFEPVALQAKDNCPLLREIHSISEEGEQYTLSSFSEEELSAEARELVLAEQRCIRSEDTAVILFTSGTTSEAKGVLLTHSNLVNTALATCKAMRWHNDDILCVALSLFHCFGLTSSLLSCVLSGMTFCLLSQFRASQVMKAVEKYHCTVFNGVPTMFLSLYRHKNFSDYDLSSLRSGIIAGSAIYSQDMEQLHLRLPKLTLIPSYGLTETSPGVTFADYDEDASVRDASSGKAVEGVEVEIRNDKGEALGALTPGEICVKGFNVMQGYYRREEETRAVFDGQWLRTGDVGMLDEQGHLFIQGRIKETINRGGENISPTEVESVIRALPWVADAVVIGIPAPIIQEEVVACIIPDIPGEIREEDIRASLKDRLADYKIPVRYFCFESFPTTSSGKVKRTELREEVLQRLKEE